MSKKAIMSLAIVAIVLIAALFVEFVILKDFDPEKQTFEQYITKTTPMTTPEFNGELTVYTIDVGQGDSSLLISPNGKTMLIDSGEHTEYQAVSKLLDKLNIDTLDVVVATHPHSDHIGCMDKIIYNYNIKSFYLTFATNSLKSYEYMIKALETNSDIEVFMADASSDNPYISWDSDVTVRILSPFNDEIYEDLNNSSIMLHIKYGNTSMLFTGDAGKSAESIALSRLPLTTLEADVLKVGHHGSSDSSSESFVRTVSPKYAIISVGADNDYDHPHEGTISNLKQAQAKIYRTDAHGTIRTVLNGSEVEVGSYRY